MNSITKIPNETTCRKKLHKIIWGDYSCPNCMSKNLKFRSKYEYCPDCKHKFSIKSESIFKNSKLELRTIYALILCWQNKCSIGEVTRTVSVSYYTARKYFDLFRKNLPNDRINDVNTAPTNLVEVKKDKNLELRRYVYRDGSYEDTELVSNDLLSGLVEIDESYFGKKKYGRQTCVVGAIERDTRRIKLRIIDDRERETLESFIVANVKVNSLIFTDGLPSYNQLPEIGYGHEDCNHSKGDFGPTNMIENLWGVIKRHLRQVHKNLSFDRDKLDNILREWENRQNSPELFYNVDNYLKRCACSV